MSRPTRRAGGARARKPLFSEGYKRAVLATLTLVYTLNFIDRTIVGIIGQPMKESLGITDNQLGLLGGLAFALLYTILGVPIARLAERVSRVNIIAICITLWSGFTALCGIAPNFAVMLAMRVGVGIGEAGCSPPAHSLISDYYEPKRRASALSVYAFGIPLGGMLGAIFGGLIAQYLNWRMAFFIVGLPGVLVAIALKLIVKEPPRGHSEIAGPPGPAGGRDAGGDRHAAGAQLRQEIAYEVRELGIVGRRIFGTWSFLNMALGVTLASFAGYGAGAFSSPYFIRTFGLGLALVGVLFGIIGGVSSGSGTLLGGFVTDWLSKRSAGLVRADAGHRPGDRAADLHRRLHPHRLARRGLDPAAAGHLPVHLPRPDLRGDPERGRHPPPRHGDGAAVPVPQPDRARRRAAVHRLADRPVRPVQLHPPGRPLDLATLGRMFAARRGGRRRSSATCAPAACRRRASPRR